MSRVSTHCRIAIITLTQAIGWLTSLSPPARAAWPDFSVANAHCRITACIQHCTGIFLLYATSHCLIEALVTSTSTSVSLSRWLQYCSLHLTAAGCLWGGGANRVFKVTYLLHLASTFMEGEVGVDCGLRNSSQSRIVIFFLTCNPSSAEYEHIVFHCVAFSARFEIGTCVCV